MAKVLGVGGIFFKSKDPEALGKWYQEHLGVEIDPSFGGASFAAAKMPKDGYTVWSPFSAKTDYFEPSKSNFMFNLIVDDLEGAMKQVEAGGAVLHGQEEEAEFGLFGWFSDPDGNKVELWQPPSN